MNNLQKLIKLRGLTIRDISRKIDQGYHITQKVVKGTRYKRKDGSFGLYSSRLVENGVAMLLKCSHSDIWGTKADLTLRRLIKTEIRSQTKRQERELQQQWLPSNNITKKRKTGNV